jgi:hypothetical protein
MLMMVFLFPNFWVLKVFDKFSQILAITLFFLNFPKFSQKIVTTIQKFALKKMLMRMTFGQLQFFCYVSSK